MALYEGMTRIAKAIRLTGYWLGGLCALGGLVLALALGKSLPDQLAAVATGAFLLALFAGGGHILAWIIEGFAAQK